MKPASNVKYPLLLYLVYMLGMPAFCQDTGGSPSGHGNKLSGLINSDQSNELAPSITADGQTMVFICDKTGSLKLYMSTKDKAGNWTAPQSLDQINYATDSSEQFDGVSISYDGNELFYSANSKKTNGNNDIFVSERNGNNWSKPVSLGSGINTHDYEGSPSISPDGKTLYFSRIKKDFKDKDLNESCYFICRSNRNPDGSWTAPEALPMPVNFQCDKSPRILADNKTMIFSSFRPGTQGGYDLYQSQVDPDGEWSSPVPLTFVNTPQSDSYAAVPASGDLLYYSYNGDILSVSIPENMRPMKCLVLKGTVKDAANKNFLPVHISITNAMTAEKVFTTSNNKSDGSYSLVLDNGKYYNVEFSKAGYTTSAFSFDLRSASQSDEFSQAVSLSASVQVRLSIRDSELITPIPASIKVMNELNGDQVTSLTNDVNSPGSIINLKVGAKYKVNIDLPQYDPKSVIYDLTKPVLFPQIESKFTLSPVRIKLPVNVTDYYNSRSLNGKVLFSNMNFPDEVFEVNSNEEANLRVGNQYQVEALTDNGYFFTYATVNISENGVKIINAGNPELINLTGNAMDIKLIPVVPNSIIKLDKVGFEPLTARLTEDSYAQLDMIIRVMKANPTVRIEITDKYVDGTLRFSQELAKERSRSISDYLIAGNISGKRITQRGIGNVGEMPAKEGRNPNSAELKVLEVLK